MECSSCGLDGFLVHFLRRQNNPRSISVLLGLPDTENGGTSIRRKVGDYTPNGKTGCARRRRIDPFEKSEIQRNVWQDTLMTAIKRQDKHK